jgi:hypothetical protein
VYCTASTLDGYIANAEDSLDWLFAQDIDAIERPRRHAP